MLIMYNIDLFSY